MRAIELRTEYLKEPIGLDASRPTLSWKCEGGIRQTAWQIIARDDAGNLLWDSGKTEGQSMRAVWGGEDIPPQTHVCWQVRLWDENDLSEAKAGAEAETEAMAENCAAAESGDESETYFETGIGSWSAKWITGNYRVNRKKRYPVDCFRKTFRAEKVRKARLHVTACGLYEARLNGQRIGDFELAPGITDYRKRVQYQTYDVTALLNGMDVRDNADGSAGDNAGGSRCGSAGGNACLNELTVQLADGWYRGSTGAWGLKNQYGTETKFLAELVLTHEDGTVEMIGTDESWSWSNDGPIRFADNKDGEIVDAAKAPTYSGSAKVTSHPVKPTASNNVPLTGHERLHAKLIRTPSGKTVLDFGQNIAGQIEFALRAKAGQRVFLRFGELIDDSGEFTQKNIQCHNKRITTPLQQTEYFCREGENHYRTTFAIFGFRYALVETDVPFEAKDFTAVAVYSDMERTGWFESSNPLLDQLFENTVWSAKNNHADLPTDCPTRERHGWTGDAQIFCSTASFLFSYRPMAEKFLRDMYDWQRKSGCLPQIAPSGGTDFYMYTMNGSVGWADAGVIMPWVLSKQYGDIGILEKHYDGMRHYARFMMRRCGKWGGPYARPVRIPAKHKKFLVNRGQSYGEWAEPQDVYAMHFMDFAGPHPEVSTAYTAYVMGLMAEIAKLTGHGEDVPEYEKYRDGCRETYQAMMRTEEFSLDTDRQARLVRPLAFGLLDEEQTGFARKRLISALDHYGWRLGTGFLSTPLILDVLADIDPEAAYRLLENEEMPGWLFMPKNGATTIWESWEGDKASGSGVASLDHYSKGAACRWLFDTMCGIHVDSENHFVIRPVPGGHFTRAKAVYDSIYGKVESGWEVSEAGNDEAVSEAVGETEHTSGTDAESHSRHCFRVVIPANCNAEVVLPDRSRHEVGTGTWEFRTEAVNFN